MTTAHERTLGWGCASASRLHLERVEEQVAEEANEPQHGAFGDGLIDDEGEEDGVNPQQRDESQSGFSQSAPKKNKKKGGGRGGGGQGVGGWRRSRRSSICQTRTERKKKKTLRTTSRGLN